MCGRYSLSDPGDLLVELGVEAATADPPLAPRYNIAPTQEAPVVRARRGSSARELVHLRWGLVPHWAGDPSVGSRMINARCESVAERPAYRKAFRWRRCAVLADGFYEWKALSAPRGRGRTRKQPFHITRPARSPFVFAGLWERWGDRQAPLETFTIVTCQPTAEIAELHDRMPVILGEEARELWLDPEIEDPGLLVSLLGAWAEPLVITPVSNFVGSPANDGPECIAPLTSPTDPDSTEEDPQSRLF